MEGKGSRGHSQEVSEIWLRSLQPVRQGQHDSWPGKDAIGQTRMKLSNFGMQAVSGSLYFHENSFLVHSLRVLIVSGYLYIHVPKVPLAAP